MCCEGEHTKEAAYFIRVEGKLAGLRSPLPAQGGGSPAQVLCFRVE